MNTLINQMPPTLYATILIICIIGLVYSMIANRHNSQLPKTMFPGFVLFIISMTGLIILKLKLLPSSIESGAGTATVCIGAVGTAIIFISGYLHNKKLGIKIDPTLKKIMIGCLIVILVCIPILIFCLYMGGRL